MIGRLRRRHRAMVTVLASTVPLLFVVALTLRPGAGAVRPHPPAEGTRVAFFPRLWSGQELGVELRRVGDGKLLLRVEGATELPDPLVYWSRAGASDENLPADAVLLGDLEQARAGLPLPAVGGGELLLYSLGRGAVAERAVLPSPAPGAGE